MTIVRIDETGLFQRGTQPDVLTPPFYSGYIRPHPPQVGWLEDWVAELNEGTSETAWDLFLDRYRRLIFAAIRHYAQDYDDVMDVFARVCEALRHDDLRRLRVYVNEPHHRARFSTWLVTVVRHLTIDWFRHKDGRRRLSVVAEGLPPLRRRIFEQVFLDRRSHVETYELLKSAEGLGLSFGQFLAEVAATYRAVTDGRRGSVLRELGSPQLPENEPDAPSAEDASETVACVQQALGTLSAEDRVAVELYVVDELPASDIARVLGLPNAKAVYNRVYRALAAVRKRLEEAGIRREDV